MRELIPEVLQQAHLARHEDEGMKQKPQILELSDEPIKFQKHEAKVKRPFIGFFDFESNCVPVDKKDQCLKCSKAKCVHKTRIEAVQKPNGYSLIIIDQFGEVIIKTSYLGEDPVNHFLKYLLKAHSSVLEPLFQKCPEARLTDVEQEEFEKATHCYLCDEPLNNKGFDDRVRDHDHASGNFLGAAHQVCNLQRKELKKLPLFCHNFSG